MIQRAIGIGVFVVMCGVVPGSRVEAVGPFMENERPPGSQVEGPAPDLRPPTVTSIPREKTVTGEVLKIEREYYMVKEESGKEVNLQIDRNTKMTIPPKVGDRIQVEVTPQGHAQKVEPARHPEHKGTGSFLKRGDEE